MTRKHIFPAGVYLITDPCHVIPNDEWGGIIEATNCFGIGNKKATDFDDGVYHWKGSTCFAGFTAYGDGIYSDGKHRYKIGVDAGLIGIMPLETARDKGKTRPYFGNIVEFKTNFTVWEKDGVFHFGRIEINTN